MKKSARDAVVFLAGMAFGSVVTWRLVKAKYERIAQEEIDSVKEVFSKNRKAETVSEEKETSAYNVVNAHVGNFYGLGDSAGAGFAAGIAGKVEAVASQAGAMVRRAIADEAKEKPDISEYAELLKQYGYTYDQENTKPEKGAEKNMDSERPYVIDPDEFGEFEDYDKICLTYYSDGILADDLDELVEDIEDVVGMDSLGHFGEYEDDAVHVRNDRLKADYEILRDSRTYRETTGRDVYGPEAEEP